MEAPKASALKGDAGTPSTVPTNGHHHYTASKENSSSQYIEGSHSASAKVETPLKDLNNDTAAAPSALPTNTDLQGPPSKNGLKIASLEAHIRELEAELDSQRRQGPGEPFFYTPPLGYKKTGPFHCLNGASKEESVSKSLISFHKSTAQHTKWKI